MNKYISAHPIYSDEDAKIIGSFIDETFGGKVTPDDLVQAAKKSTSPIHDYFEWDDKKAAAQHRIQQARRMINAICIIDHGEQIRAYHSCYLEGETKSYFSNDLIREAPDLASQVIDNAKKQLFVWKQRYQQYEEFFSIVSEIKQLERTQNDKEKRNKGKVKKRGKGR